MRILAFTRQTSVLLSILVLLFTVHLERITASAASSEKEVEDDEDDEDEEETEIPNIQVAKPVKPRETGGAGGTPPKSDKSSGKASARKRSKAPKGQKAPAAPGLNDDDEDEDRLDPDEFEGFDGTAAASAAAEAPGSAAADGPGPSISKDKAPPRQPAAPPQRRRERSLGDLRMEMAALAALVVYAINYMFGRERNRRLAEQWYQACADVLDANFAMVGQNHSHRLAREGAAQFRVYCSGRVNCESALVTINLRPRHDLISLLWELIQSSYQGAFDDTATLEVAMGQTVETGGQMEGFALAVLPKGDEATVRNECRDLENRLAVRKWKTALHDSLVCMSDEEEVTRELLTDAMIRSINEHRQHLRLLHISDRLAINPAIARRGQATQPGIRVVLKLQPKTRSVVKDKAAASAAAELLAASLRYIDKCATYQMSAAAKDRRKKLLAQLAEYEFKKTRGKREADAQQRKLDKMRKEKEALEGMSPEQAAKYEEKLLKKQRKAAGPVKAIKIK